MRSNIEHTKRSQYGIANLRGEVDVLCLDVDSATIWVIEVKDPSEPFSQRRIGNIVANFNKPDGYVDKLLGKTSDIQASASTVVKTLAPDTSAQGLADTATDRYTKCLPRSVHERTSCQVLHTGGSTRSNPRCGLLSLREIGMRATSLNGRLCSSCWWTDKRKRDR